ncbi:MAG: hypothetical protein CVU38_12235 [Chloroflexi bacterium HGW-Chloroflexi-1]|nr:MAG: hypothetical protein CVU38_12235 [Chloroflexi bacterium HGW-Chloroflexi-1]
MAVIIQSIEYPEMTAVSRRVSGRISERVFRFVTPANDTGLLTASAKSARVQTFGGIGHRNV